MNLTNREAREWGRMLFIQSGESLGIIPLADSLDELAYLSLCLRDPDMVKAFPLEDERRAVALAAFANKPKQADNDDEDLIPGKKKKPKGGEMTADIFAVGLWNGMEFTVDDLRQIASAFHTLGANHSVPLKFGHNEEQPFTDGQPALGWVADVFVEGDKLKARFVDVPAVVIEAIESRRYSKVSVELDMGVEHGGKYFPLVLSGVALLGADIPAVNTLEDLQAFMGRESIRGARRSLFTAITTQEEDNPMSDDKIKAEREAFVAQLKEQAEASAKFQREAQELRTLIAERDKTDKVVKFAAKRVDYAARLNVLVKESKITPAQRDGVMAEWRDEDAIADTIAFTVAQFEQLPASKPFQKDDKSRQNTQDDKDADKTPGEILLSRVREIRGIEPRLDFSAAVRRAMEADPKLAREYIDENGVLADNRRAVA